MARARELIVVLLCLSLAAGAASGQQRARVDVTVARAGGGQVQPPVVRSEGLLADRRIHDLLRAGFPARIHYTLERWRVRRAFDNLRATYEWDVVVRYDPLRSMYRVVRLRGDEVIELGSYPSVAEADSAVSVPLMLQIPMPAANERSYFALRVDVEMVSVSDLNELERWLKGELRPAIRGDRRPTSALEGGARTALIRLLGGEKRRYTARSGKFTP